MQQTENHKLNLIEPGDPFSPEALNENTQAIDAALTRFTCGTYTGNGASSRMVELPFTPKLVYVGNGVGCIFYYTGYYFYVGGLALPGLPAMAFSFPLVTIVEGGFQVGHSSDTLSSNNKGSGYRYFAFG